MIEWHNVNTKSPEPGAHVIVYVEKYDFYCVAIYKGHDQWYCTIPENNLKKHLITHWSLLNKPD